MMNKTNFRIDLSLFFAMIILQMGPVLGVTFHVSLGLLLTAVVLIHLILHRKWIVAAFGGTKGSSGKRMNRLRVLNIILGIFFILTIVTGVLNALSLDQVRAAGQQSGQSAVAERSSGHGPFGDRDGGRFENRARGEFHWHAMHHLFAALTMITLIIHLGHHWSWIKSSARQMFGLQMNRANTTAD